MIHDLKLESIAGQIRHAIGDIDQRIRELRETCSDSVTTELEETPADDVVACALAWQSVERKLDELIAIAQEEYRG